jgi:hypothetical protein
MDPGIGLPQARPDRKSSAQLTRHWHRAAIALVVPAGEWKSKPGGATSASCGQRELGSRTDPGALTDEAAGKILYPGPSAGELKNTNKADYVAETATKIITRGSRGAGDVAESIQQVEPAPDTPYVKGALKRVRPWGVGAIWNPLRPLVGATWASVTRPCRIRWSTGSRSR